MSGELPKGRLPKQLVLRFPEAALGFDDLCISASNEAALSVIREVDRWPSPALCLLGPAESGLTTAVNVWAKETGASLISASEFDQLTHEEIDTLSQTHTAIDRADQITSSDNLLSIINLSGSHETHVLLSAQVSPANWAARNPDLRSRLEAMPIAEFDAPDDALLEARLKAACRRRYLKLPPDVATYLSHRMERSFASIEDLATRLDLKVQETGRKLTVPVARDVLNEGAGTRALFEDDTD